MAPRQATAGAGGAGGGRADDAGRRPAVLAVEIGGVLGEAVAASRRGRLFHFIRDETSPPVALFEPERADLNTEGDWYGEHAGKWLIAASRAAGGPGAMHGEGRAALAGAVRRVADHLVALQRPDGYLGTYAPTHRFTVPQPPKPPSWDGAPSVRTWDIWTHAYLILGLLEADRQLGGAHWRDAACRIGLLCLATLQRGDIDITDLGNHHGMSATVLIDPAVELHRATGDARFLALAQRVLAQADAHPPLALLQRARAGVDAAEIATGKAYQLAWNLVGLAKLHAANVARGGDASLLPAVEAVWRSVREHHLSLGGGPWGGVGLRSRECFNPPGVFSPHGYVETCSTLAWMQLNRELLAITGHPRHADEIERSAYNDLLGALAPNGEDWCYYSFANGRRVHTTAWRCCKSSGAMALEELPLAAVRVRGDAGVVVDLYAPMTVTLHLPQAGTVRLRQATGYPDDGDVALRLEVERPARFTLRLRIPAWAEGATLAVVDGHGAGVEGGGEVGMDLGAEVGVDGGMDGGVRGSDGAEHSDGSGGPRGLAAPRAQGHAGSAVHAVEAGRYAGVERVWRTGDTLRLHLPLQARLHRRVNRNVQESKAPDGRWVRQQVLHERWLAITRGPLVYATGLIDGHKAGECIPDPGADAAGCVEELPADGERAAPAGATGGTLGNTTQRPDAAPTLRLHAAGRAPIDFVPAYRAGGRVDGAWRITWLQLSPTPDDHAAPASADGAASNAGDDGGRDASADKATDAGPKGVSDAGAAVHAEADAHAHVGVDADADAGTDADADADANANADADVDVDGDAVAGTGTGTGTGSIADNNAGAVHPPGAAKFP